jgi:FG-GAP-like repeat
MRKGDGVASWVRVGRLRIQTFVSENEAETQPTKNRRTFLASFIDKPRALLQQLRLVLRCSWRSPAHPSDSAAIADLNGDGKPDLVISSSGGSYVRVLLGNGDGTFRSPSGYYAGGSGGAAVTIADVNGEASLTS